MIYDYTLSWGISAIRCRNATLSAVEFVYSNRRQGRVTVGVEGMVPRLLQGRIRRTKDDY
jgi:hypothetical protein